MPFSSESGKFFTDRAIQRLVKQTEHSFFKHRKILDLGPGSGTYSKRYSSTWLKRPEFSWVAVEIWEPYVAKYGLRGLYDEVQISDAVKYVIAKADEGTDKFDICFIGDLLEHMPKEAAIALVKNALKISSIVIVSIPIVHYPQDEYDGNPYEKHVKDDWSDVEMVETFKDVLLSNGAAVEREIGVYVLSTDNFYRHLVDHVLEPQVGIYAICKNEVKFIERMYESIKGADYISICDTGSTDGTWELLTKLTHSHSEFLGHEDLFSTSENRADCHFMHCRKIGVNPWRFDDAHNAALLALPEEIDVCVSIDADEMLGSSDFLTALKSQIANDLRILGRPRDRYNHRFSTWWNWDKPEQERNVSSHWHERIHARHGLVWKLPVHEVLVKLDGTPENVGWASGLLMVQHPDTVKSRSSYLPLLEISVREDPNRWKSWSFLAGEYANIGRWDDAVKACQTALGCTDPDKAHLNAQLAGFYLRRGDKKTAAFYSFSATLEAPTTREYQVYLADVYEAMGNKRLALATLLEAEKLTERSSGYQYNPSCWDDGFEKRKQRVKDFEG